ncbi:uncharacterized protein LOC117180594 [Belonocnema kinseyi]|uniref:uncharacterized protein LOC117180594 n=1 Tax=Belonocnema kinseyi TaxID=2817044 RepID=UPI00143DB259|nr:uncharacterized protein LOC117180594 [Belonocnema kinseyi]
MSRLPSDDILASSPLATLRCVLVKRRQKLEVIRCYRCLNFGHRAASCKGSDRTKACWRCGAEGHKSAKCVSAPLGFLCSARSEKPRSNHLLADEPVARHSRATDNDVHIMAGLVQERAIPKRSPEEDKVGTRN